MNRKLLTTVLMLGLAAGVAGAEEATKWLNVHVVEHGEGGATVEVRLPMSLILSVIDSIDVEGFSQGRVDLELDDADIDWPALLQAIKDAPDAEFVRVTSDDENVIVSKRQGSVHIHVTGNDEDTPEEVEVTLPVELLDVLTVDDTNHLDVRAILARLDQISIGDIVRVKSTDADVRVWIE